MRLDYDHYILSLISVENEYIVIRLYDSKSIY